MSFLSVLNNKIGSSSSSSSSSSLFVYLSNRYIILSICGSISIGLLTYRNFKQNNIQKNILQNKNIILQNLTKENIILQNKITQNHVLLDKFINSISENTNYNLTPIIITKLNNITQKYKKNHNTGNELDKNNEIINYNPIKPKQVKFVM